MPIDDSWNSTQLRVVDDANIDESPGVATPGLLRIAIAKTPNPGFFITMVDDVLQYGSLVPNRFNRNDLATDSPQPSAIPTVSPFVPEFSFQATEYFDDLILVTSHLDMQVATAKCQRYDFNTGRQQMLHCDATERFAFVLRQDSSGEPLEES